MSELSAALLRVVYAHVARSAIDLLCPRIVPDDGADLKSTVQIGFAQMHQKLLDCREGIAAVDRKVSKQNGRRKRRGKYDDGRAALCVACVDAAKGDSSTPRGKSGTKLRLEDVFNRYRAKLRENGVEDFATFRRIIHACRASESRARIKALAAKQDAARRNGDVGPAGRLRQTAAPPTSDREAS